MGPSDAAAIHTARSRRCCDHRFRRYDGGERQADLSGVRVMTQERWFTRLAHIRTSRRTAGVLGAFLIAARPVPHASGDTPRRRKRRRQRRRCGGIAGISCPDGFICVDDHRDECNPSQGGADCSGLCVRPDPNPCSLIRCASGRQCCPLCGGLCLPPDVRCREAVCREESCNGVTCGPGQYCCNPSCQQCVDLGAGCTKKVCPPEDLAGEPCGSRVCPTGQVCCNASCGICTAPGGACILIACEP